MKSILTTLLFIAGAQAAFSQEFQFDIHHKKLTELIQLEKQLNSKPIENTSYYPGSEMQPVSFLREEKTLPDLIVQYDFNKDSTLNKILYEWDVFNFDKKPDNKQSPELQMAFIEKYHQLEKAISSRFGESSDERGDLSQLSLISQAGGLKKRNLWKPDDSTEIELYTVISNFYQKKELVTTNPTHRIRLYVRNRSEAQKPELLLPKQRLASLDSISHVFLEALAGGDLAQARSFLSELIAGKTTDKQLTGLTDQIAISRKLSLVESRLQLTTSGSLFTLLLYKYADDPSEAPTQMIRFVFDSLDKIAGVQPIQAAGKTTD